MSTTVADILDSVALRRGESSSPDNATEKRRRISFINKGYMAVLQKDTFWFTQKTDTVDSVASQEIYTLPTDFREMDEVRVDDIIRNPIPDYTIFDTYRYPPMVLTSRYYGDQYYYIYGGDIHFIPVTPTTGTNTIQYRYFYWPTKLTATTDTILIPDQYVECLTAYCEARLNKLEGVRGDASDAFDEFNEIVGEMIKENNRRKLSGVPLHP